MHLSVYAHFKWISTDLQTINGRCMIAINVTMKSSMVSLISNPHETTYKLSMKEEQGTGLSVASLFLST